MGSDNFCLKTAIAFIPVMNGQEHVTKALIDSIEFYSDMLNEKGREILIKFVLKTRLSEIGKFYLKSDYCDVTDLLYEMKKKLLTKKSHVCLQQQLFNCKQGSRTIQEFGMEIEQLLVDLTQAQLDFLGSTESRNILLPINEKTAVKCFTDGLTNSRLRLIMACRQLENLHEAIQIASEECMMMDISENNRMSFESKRGFRNISNIFYKKNDNYNSWMNVYSDRNVRNGIKYYTSKRKHFEETKGNDYKNQPVCHALSAKLRIPKAQRNLTPDDKSSEQIASVPKCTDNKLKVMKFENNKDSKFVCMNVEKQFSKSQYSKSCVKGKQFASKYYNKHVEGQSMNLKNRSFILKPEGNIKANSPARFKYRYVGNVK